MKEIYKVQTPKRIVFGDPLYFEEFSGARLEQLVVDVQPPEAFGARVVLREFSAAEAPDTLIRTMEVYLAPEEDMDIYLRGMKYELQECIEKEIGVDTARYYLQVDDREDILHTGGDGYWGSYEELSRNTRDGRMVEAAILTVIWPEYESMESMRQHAQSVEKVQQKLGFFACIRYNGSGGEKDAETRKNGSGCSGDRGDRQPGAKGAPAAEDR